MHELQSTPQSDVTGPAAESSSVYTSKRTRRIAILGFGGTVKHAPIADPSWELWAMNGFWRAAEPDYGIKAPEERFALWLDMHGADYIESYGKAAGIAGKQEEWLSREHPFKILMLEEKPAWPCVVAYPLERIMAKLGRDYFTSTVAYALALALAQDDVAEIGLWGVDLVHDTEYASQRPCAEYWLGRIEAAGIKVTVHEDSALLRQRERYGYDDQGDDTLKDLTQFLDGWEAHLNKTIDENKEKHVALVRQMDTDYGALQAVGKIRERANIRKRGGRMAG